MQEEGRGTEHEKKIHSENIMHRVGAEADHKQSNTTAQWLLTDHNSLSIGQRKFQTAAPWKGAGPKWRGSPRAQGATLKGMFEIVLD